jgi:SAM-dependent methyltransferase
MLSVATGRATAGLAYVKGRAEALPFADASFHAVLCMTTLEFVQDVDAAIREAARVTRRGGRLVFGVLNADSPWARLRRKQGGIWSQARFYRAAELHDLLAPLGTVSLERCVYFPPSAQSLPVLLLTLLDAILGRLLPTSSALIGARVDLKEE